MLALALGVLVFAPTGQAHPSPTATTTATTTTTTTASSATAAATATSLDTSSGVAPDQGSSGGRTDDTPQGSTAREVGAPAATSPDTGGDDDRQGHDHELDTLDAWTPPTAAPTGPELVVRPHPVPSSTTSPRGDAATRPD